MNWINIVVYWVIVPGMLGSVARAIGEELVAAWFGWVLLLVSCGAWGFYLGRHVERLVKRSASTP